ncbi:NKG2-A/NKG2-B type II integral membrane protein-like [Trichechus manatus latirostris]|uniref:NKG2-A/NKG2-B type II integral membrane protein-like n=1 Tax=Trichechus manatus latirostris TaxID=127582 RepID=A0A2Y9QQD4_TRIMA|nr:NKG2-A/NKG2-B type II integral membrane protein-like [Trichechus manatus latirostris]
MSNQRVIYSQVKLAEYPKRQQTKPRSKNSCSISDSEQQITSVGRKLHNAAQDLQGNDKKSHCKDFPAPPGRLIAGVLRLLCLALMVGVITMTITVITPYSVKSEQNNSSPIKRTEKGDHCGRCPKAWFMYSNNCYYISTEKKSWKESRLECASKKSNLLYIDNEEEKVRFLNVSNILWKVYFS